MGIIKSSRHSKIAGDFGESLLLYWLSKMGFEIALVDHTGIDLVAYNKQTTQRYGISVKTRTRLEGTENEGIYVDPSDINKVDEACKSFACIPYFGFVIDRSSKVEVILISKENMLRLNKRGKLHINVKVNSAQLENYKRLASALFIEFEYKTSGTLT